MKNAAEHGDGQTTVSMKQWPETERPREKMLARGAEVLSDSEVLAIILNSGSGGRSALDIARDLLHRYENLRQLARRTVRELCGVPGIGHARAVTLHAAFELGRRHAAVPDQPDGVIGSPEDIASLYIPRLRDLQRERFMALLLDNAGHIIKECVISEGTVNASLVHPREVFHAAVTELASSVILLHNHPSGVREASREDHLVTRQLVEAGQLMDIPVHDHIIICGNKYVSFAENGWLEGQ
ncbi:DNA repair protein RadC [bacterium]|nr:DNA repair protein RadC [bacterium]